MARVDSNAWPILFLVRTRRYNHGQNHGQEKAYAVCNHHCVSSLVLWPLNATWHVGYLTDLKRYFTDLQLYAIRANGKAIARLNAIREWQAIAEIIFHPSETPGASRLKKPTENLAIPWHPWRYCDGRSGFECLSDTAPGPYTTLQSRTKSR